MADAFVSQHPHVSVGLIPCAKDSSSIEQWQRDLSRSTCTVHASIGKNWQSSKVRCEPWCSGRAGQAAESWAENFKKMVTAWRADIGDPNLPVIMLVLKPGTEQTLKKYPYRDIVREQQLSVQIPYLTKIGDDRLRLLRRRHSSDDEGPACTRPSHCKGPRLALS